MKAWRAILAGALLLLAPGDAWSQEPLFARSYALVIGIGDYPAKSGFEPLTYPRKDAGGMAVFLRTQGFQVIELFDQQATKRAIRAALEDGIAGRLGPNDRVLVFYSGHGQTRVIGDREYGYIIPYDADGNSSSWIDMDVLRSLSDKMGQARHQMFIMDACYGGHIGFKTGGSAQAPDYPNYVRSVAERPARQFLTAGGADQQVLDGGPDGYSYFTGYLLEALELGYADYNGDSFITASELGAYITPRASTWNQTPAIGVLPGHGQGEFLFRVPGRQTASAPGAVDSLGRFKGGSEVTKVALLAPPLEPEEVPAQPPPVEPPPPPPAPPPGAQAAERLEAALHLDYDETRRDFYRFLQRHSLQDVDTRRVVNVGVDQVIETGADGWLVKLDYFIIDRSNKMIRRQGRFLVRPTESGVEFIKFY